MSLGRGVPVVRSQKKSKHSPYSPHFYFIAPQCCDDFFLLFPFELFGLCLVGLLYSCVTVKYSWAIIVPSTGIFYYMSTYYLNASRETKRLVQLTQSPIFAHFEECLNGLKIIRNSGYREM